MKKIYGMVLVTFVALALAAPAAAQAPGGDWSGWSWSSLVEELSGWVEGVWRAVAGSETGGEEEGGGDDGGTVTASPDDTSLSTTDPDPTTNPEAWPENDPDG